MSLCQQSLRQELVQRLYYNSGLWKTVRECYSVLVAWCFLTIAICLLLVVPGPPYIDRLDPLGTTSFSVGWLPPGRPNGRLTGYIITVTNSTQHVRAGSDFGVYMVLSIDVDARETYHVVNDLTPNTNYSISLKATTSRGAGEETAIHYVKTNEESKRVVRTLGIQCSD